MSLFRNSSQLPDSERTSGEEGRAAGVPAPEDGAVAARDKAGTGGGRWTRHPVVGRVTTVLAAVLVLCALLLPPDLTRLTPSALAHIPLEAIVGAVVLLVLPPRPRKVVAAIAGVALGLLTILNFLDMGFYSELDRPFDLRLDWVLFDDAESFLRDSVGQAAAIGAVIGVVVLVLALLVLMPLAVVRLSRLPAVHPAATVRTAAVLGVAWITCAAFGAQIAGAPVAARNSGQIVYSHIQQADASLKDERTLARAASVDAFRDTPPDQLLTGLRGKDVIFAFVESYGRSAVEDPSMASQVDAVLADGTSRLRAAGFSSESAFLTSPTSGGGSWLAHSTFLSGLWITNQRSYETVTSSDRLTLTGAFRRADAWRTVGIMPGVTRAWPEGAFFGLDNIYDSHHLGYRGPAFSWSQVPDQYSLSAFERLEHGKPDHRPLMSEIILVSSHNPWAPIPKMIGWDQVGDGSVYDGIEKAGKDPKEVWKDPAKVRTEYRRSIEYSVNSLVSYVQNYGDDNTVLVFLGDHQPAPIVTGENASRDVPIAIVAHDPAVMKRIGDWGWQDGLKPGPKAPVWRMDTFRDRFLTSYGPRPGDAAPPSPSSPATP